MNKNMTCLAALLAFSTLSAGEPPQIFGAKGLEFTGFLRYRYEWTENPRVVAEDAKNVEGEYLSAPSPLGNATVDAKSETRAALGLFLDKQFGANTRFHAFLLGETLGGRAAAKCSLDFKEGFVARRMGPVEIAVGRFMPSVGLGTLGLPPCSDGVKAAVNTSMVSASAYVVKWGSQFSAEDDTVYAGRHVTYLMADAQVRPVKGLTLSAAYRTELHEEDSEMKYKGYAVGAEYVYARNQAPLLTLSAEYSKNTAGLARAFTADAPNGTPLGRLGTLEGTKNPEAYFVMAKVLGAHPFKPGTFGFGIEYRKADPGFDILGFASPLVWNAPFNWSSPSAAGAAENYKGFELTGEVTLFEGMFVKVAYGLMKTADTQAFKSLSTRGQKVLPPATPVPYWTTAATDSQKYLTVTSIYRF